MKKSLIVFMLLILFTVNVSAVGKESLTYLYGGTTISYLKALQATNHSIKTISPDYFDIDQNGNLLITPSDKIDPKFIEEMHKQGISITPFISNHWDRELGNKALENREALATQIARMVKDYHLDGVNVDIENVNEQYREQYTDFTRLLRKKLPWNKKVTVAVAANPNGWTTGWHGSYDYRSLAKYADYLMIMDYDESYLGSPPGPISGKTFFEKSILYALDQGVPKGKIVAGIPFFGRYWKTGEQVGGIGITANDVDYLIANYDSKVSYDTASESANAIVTIKESDPKPEIWGGRVLTAGTYNIWYDNLQAVKFKLNTIDRFGIKGVGSWALGQENKKIWTFYTAALNGKDVAVPMQTPDPDPPVEITLPNVPNVQRVIQTIEGQDNGRTLTNQTILTRGEVIVLLSQITNVQREIFSPSFADTLDYFGKGQINAFKRRGILSEQDNLFYPNRAITREELAVILEKILVLPNTIDFHTMKFTDLPATRPSYNAISKLYYFDILKGIDATHFNPEGNVNVQEMATILDTIDRFAYPLNPDKLLLTANERALTAPNQNTSDPILQPR